LGKNYEELKRAQISSASWPWQAKSDGLMIVVSS